MGHKFPYKWFLKDSYPAKNIEKNNLKVFDPVYLIGMSVPPVMMAQLSNQIYLQWFKHYI